MSLSAPFATGATRTYFAKFLLTAMLTLSAATTADAGEMRHGGKLLLTNGITSLEGASGGGLTPWAVIAGNETRDGVGVSAHGTIVELKDYDHQSIGAAIGAFDRVELSFALQRFNTNDIGALLGLGKDYAFEQEIYGAKVKLVGDLVYDSLPAIAVGAQYKRSRNAAIVRAIGAAHDEGVDFYASISKLFLGQSLLANGTVRLTKANQMGLLGFGGDKGDKHQLQFEGSLGWQLSRKLAVGTEFRSKPDNLGIAREDDWYDIFAVYAINRHLTATVAYADLGSIATVQGQRGALFSLQAAF